MQPLILFLALAFALFSPFVAAEDTVLMIDQTLEKETQLAFPNDNNIQPKAGDFKVMNKVPMSSESGDRWAIVTVKNPSSGSRIFESSYLIGLFADGERRPPLEHKVTVEGGETVSLTLAFGRHKFPLLDVIARD